MLPNREQQKPVPLSSCSTLQWISGAISHPKVSLVLLVIVFLHQVVGSAFYTVRQAFEVNEMEWFNGTVSLLLWLAICTCLTTASIVRIPWRWRKIGTHITHAGVVLLVIACSVYFGYKHEGDALLVRCYVKVEAEGGASCRLLPNPGYSAPLKMGTMAGTAIVQSINPRETILSSKGQSASAWAISVEFSLPQAPTFTASLIENRPDLTYYTVSSPRSESFLPDYPRVYATDGKLVVQTVDGKDVLATDLIVGAKTTEDIVIGASSECSLEIINVNSEFTFLAENIRDRKGTQIEWTLRTPAGEQSGSSIVDQPTLTQFLHARLTTAPDARLKHIALEPAPWTIAYHRDRPALWVRSEKAALITDPLQPMRAMDDQAVASLPIQGLPRYHEHGAHFMSARATSPDTEPRHSLFLVWLSRSLDSLLGIEHSPEPLDLPIGNVDGVSFNITAFAPYARLSTRWKDVAEAALDPCLDLWLTSASEDRGFARLVRPSTSAGIEEQAMSWVHCADQAAYDRLRAMLSARFPAPVAEKASQPTKGEAARTRLVFVTSPSFAAPLGTVQLLVAAPGSLVREFPLHEGGAVLVNLFGDDLTVHLNSILQRPRQVIEPVVVPRQQRTSRMTVGDNESLIQVTATSIQGVVSTWVPYTPYPNLPRSLLNEGPLGMYSPRPVWLDVPGAGLYELTYSKEALPMPGPIWMTGFEVPRRPGSDSPSEFFCHVGYGDVAKPATATIHMNHPLAWHNIFFFQAGWDPQSESLTVLGVGNRPAGTAMMIASIILALGMAISGATAALAKRTL